MAKPIKETPVLKGKDAQKFIQNMSNPDRKKADTKEIAKIKANFSKLHSISKF